MKKLVILLVVLAITMPALAANVDFTVANTGTPGDMQVLITYDAETGHGLRGIALRIELVGCELTVAGDAGAMGAGLNTAIDFARDMEVNEQGSYGGPLPAQSDQHPIAKIPGPGKAVFPATVFSISAGKLASDQSTTPDGAQNVIVLDLTDTNGSGTESTIAISSDDGRGGPFVNDNVGPTVSFSHPPTSALVIAEAVGCVIPCWDALTQCHGDSRGASPGVPDGVVNTVDWPDFRDGFGNSYPSATYLTYVCADYDRDGAINTVDWPAFRDNFGTSPPANCTPLCGTWPPI